ncbi:hypothetical protein J3E07_001648 [Methanococcus voltae]|uniref:Uncharacterized protein n=1 Tax=Methanococcus voltae TaxID=2188 RepID=A0A8J7RHZ7_METVO|nr:hypothetical protein [Methanococcus voltae]MBP2202207.1 hypothetical protein [Methanococcus voltae]
MGLAKNALLIILGGVLVIAALVGGGYIQTDGDYMAQFSNLNVGNLGTPNETQLEEQAITVPYNDLFRHNSEYVGKLVHYRGKVLQVVVNGDKDYDLRVATNFTERVGYDSKVTKMYNKDIIYVTYKGDILLEGDMVDIYGRVTGLKSYQNLVFDTVSIPEINAIKIEIEE